MPEQPRALSVTEAMGLARRALEGLSLRVVGEVTELTDRAGYKAVYFTLGDGSSVMPCLIWRDAFESCGVPLRCGMLVEVTGALTVYAPKGRMQFQVRTLAAAGEGMLRLQVAALARKLEAEGLMRPERKRPLPEYPERIGLVTSPRGKAVHDVIRTLRRRYPVAELVVAGIAVEGASAFRDIVRGMREVGGQPGVEVVILCRGGGTYEDLMPFNAEEVARAVAECPVPVVTGIGHEPDTSIADMVADLRASTPTAAAEAVAPCVEEVSDRFTSVARLLGRALLHTLQRARHRLAIVRAARWATDCRALTGTYAQRLDIAATGLYRALPQRFARDRERLSVARAGLPKAGAGAVSRHRERAALMAARLEDLSPLGILGRGYAVCYDASGTRVIRAASELSPGDRVRVRVQRGSAGCLVENVEREPEA